MPIYRADLTDIEFNLFELFKVQELAEYGMDQAAMKDILYQYEKFVRQEIYPTRSPSDKEGVHLVNGKVQAPASLKKVHQSFYENGWFALGLPEEIGGAPAPDALTIACMSLSNGANTAYMMYPGLSKSALNVIRLKGNEWMKKFLIPPLMEGRWGGTMCLTEAGAGSDVGALRTTATPQSDGTYLIKGTKIFISGGEVDLYENSIHLVLARTPTGAPGTKGISLFVVPRNWVDEKGTMLASNDVTCSKVEEKMGIHASATCELQFGAKGQCKGYLIGDEFDGMATMFIMMNEARLLCGLQGESQANLAYEFSKAYAKERVQFGQEIAKHADVKKMLLKMRAVSRGMRQLSIYTAHLFDLQKQNPKFHELINFLTPICKAYFTEQGLQVACDAVQVHGGYGFCQEYEVEQFVRDTIIGRIYEGTNGIQAMDLVMRKVVKDQAATLSWLMEMMGTDLQKLASVFPAEVGLWKECAQKISEVTKEFFKKASSGMMTHILQHSSDYLMMCSYLIMSWQLGKSALLAQEKIQMGAYSNEEHKQYYETKIVDFEIYCQHYLVHAQSLATTMNLGKKDLLQAFI